MISTFIIVLISLLNMLLAIGMVYTFEDVKLLKNKGFRLFLLIPPLAITIFFCVTIYGILYSLYMLLMNYFSND
jgi:hypothetical protein